uniref:Glucose-methanol-choline oxidoreductase N-terminal domain-containing protein n=1 Tax=Haptolina brevifila TaxID=156173 RepID=A0A7S2IFJ9_9EUKA
MAERLSAEPDARVLVLEAGTDGRNDLRIRIPAALIKVFKSERDWDFNTEPNAATKGREVYLCRGKVLGGSSCTNVMLYHRGTAADYNNWLAAGADGWGPSEVLEYYRKAEHSLDGASQYHGVGGPMPVDDVPYINQLSEAFLGAAGELGYRRNLDFNDWSSPQDGFGRFKVTQRNGERCSAANGYLEGAECRENLCIRTGVHVTKVTLEGEGDDLCACGVEYIGEGGKPCRAALASGGEVLLSAGAVQSPQLLMLSGIGPREHLEERGIPVRKELAAVGEGLQDHPAVLVSYGSKKAVSVTDEIRLMGSALPNPLTLLRWMLFKRGALTSVACEFGGFFRTSETQPQPDVQVRFIAARAESADGISTLQKMGQGKRMRSGYTTQIVACRPKSEGRVRLRNADPLCKPLLENIHLSKEEDIATLREGIKLGRKLCNAESFDDYRSEEIFPSLAVSSDEEIDDYIRSSVHSANALTGSCRMGRESDESAVLDPAMRVRGVGSLRVVDASAMPSIVGGQTCAPTIMMAEKAADMVLSQRAAMRRHAVMAHQAQAEQAEQAHATQVRAAYEAAAAAQGLQGAAA